MRIVVLTCDKFNFIINHFWHFFVKNFPDNPYPVDFVTEHTKINIGDNQYYYGDIPWSTRLHNYLTAIDDERIAILLDDYILTQNVDLPLFEKCVVTCRNNDVGVIQLLPYGKPYGCCREDYLDDFKIYPFDSPRSVGMQATIWDVEYLLKVLVPGQSIWKAEHIGWNRMKNLNEKILFCKDYVVRYEVGGCMNKKVGKVQEVWDWMSNNW